MRSSCKILCCFWYCAAFFFFLKILGILISTKIAYTNDIIYFLPILCLGLILTILTVELKIFWVSSIRFHLGLLNCCRVVIKVFNFFFFSLLNRIWALWSWESWNQDLFVKASSLWWCQTRWELVMLFFI